MKSVIVLMLLTTPAFAAPPKPEDVIASYKFLLTEANDRIAVLNAQIVGDNAEIAELKKKKDAPDDAH